MISNEPQERGEAADHEHDWYNKDAVTLGCYDCTKEQPSVAPFPAPKTCAWKRARAPMADWITSCGSAYYLDEEFTPISARMKFCMFCGLPLQEKQG